MKKIYALIILLTFSSAIAQTDSKKIINKNQTSRIERDPIIIDPGIDPIIIDPGIDPIDSTPLPLPPPPRPTEVGVTAGQLSVSLTGGANYNVPISTPPGINGIEPKIALNYNSQSGNGLAGFGWNISGLSSISRIPSTKFHDNGIDPVDFDASDRFALDGQRLILKAGNYGVVGSEYETENYSNLKISLLSGVGNYFKVEYPDGSVAYYGYSADSNTDISYALTYWENPQGIRISYIYNKTNNNLYISSIKYGSVGVTNPINEVQFVYNTRIRAEKSYIGGISVINDKILYQIKVIGKAIGYRNYRLSYDSTLGYQRLTSITEKTGDNSKSYIPTIFSYENTSELIDTAITLAGHPTCTNCQTPSALNGDFNGDGELDILRFPKFEKDPLFLGTNKYIINYGLKTYSDPNAYNMGVIKSMSGRFNNIFSVSYLKGNSSDYKLGSGNGWCEVTIDPITNKTSFNIYTISNNVANPINLEYTKEYSFPKSCFFKDAVTVYNNGVPTVVPGSYNNATTNKQYFSGDFNGDQLTDLIVIERGATDLDRETSTCTVGSTPFQAGKTYFVNLDKRAQSNYVNFSGYIDVTKKDYYTWRQDYQNEDNYGHSKLFATDVTGDGKTDMVVFKYVSFNTSYANVTIDVYSLNDLNTLVKVSTTNFNNIHWDNSEFYPVDLNGDGKMDFVSRFKDYISTGNSFATTSTSQFFDKNPMFIDMDKDGKADLVSTNTNSTTGDFTVAYSKNINGTFSNPVTCVKTFTKSYITANYLQDMIGIMLTSEDAYKNSELCFISKGGGILHIKAQKDFSREKLLQSIASGNGVTENIVYSSLIDGNDVYTKANQIENYPNFDLGFASSFKVVSQIERFSTSLYKNQLFKYYGAVSNIEGLGFLGFRSVLKTNWFGDTSQVISSITKSDISKRGAPVENFSVSGIVSPTLTLSPTDTFINKSLNTYNNENTVYENPLLSNKVFKLKNTRAESFNGLEGTSSETETQYNSNNNRTQTTTSIKKGAIVEQTSVNIFSYDTPISTPYIIDRPLSKTSTTKIFPSNDITSSEELYAYNGNLLTQVRKKGIGTVYLTEDNEYDIYGNITKKTISAPGLTPRISNFEYDTNTHRFLTKKTDLEGRATNYSYNESSGLLLEESFPSIQTSILKITHIYDMWGKLISSKNIYDKTESYSYANLPEGGYLKTITGEDSSLTKITFDELGREIRNEIKNIDDTFSYVDTNYDIYDRVIYKTEPYSAYPEVWNEAEYDVYGKLIKTTSLKSSSSPGKVINYSYSGLTVIENDGVKRKETINNAIGRPISVTEIPGGQINYTYFADGNLKSTDYSGGSIIITQDGWGRKETLNDPSAGNRKYKYNHFGELTSEEIVNVGITEYDINNFGKISLKTIKDAGGNIKSKNTYTYNTTNRLLASLRFDDVTNGFYTIYNYDYDDYNQVINTEENIDSRASFYKTIFYDDFGRPLSESYLAENKLDGKMSSKSISYVYKNGYKSKIIDDDTGLSLWEINNVIPQGKLKKATLGNGIIINNTYDVFGFPTQIKHDKGISNIMTLNNVFDPIRGNLTSRTNNMFGAWSESLVYDTSDRLTTYKDAVNVQTQTYNDNGTIANNNIGNYAYGITGKPFQVSSVTPVDQTITSSILNYYEPRVQKIAYNIFKSPISITEATVENIDFEYNAFNSRTAMYYGGLQTNKILRPYRKFYSADGTMEIRVKTSSPTSVEFVTYLGGDAYTAPIVLKSDGTTQKLYYLHRDYQGTIVGITNSSGVIVEKRLFDVWGALIKYANNSGVNTVPTSSTGLFLDRGYTGHEHLLGVGLVNMNGRIYDPKLHRFLQPDNNVQDPNNTQNYNRYAYVMNNPTKYTDASGENWLTFIVQFIISTYVHGAQATGNPNPLEWNAGQYLNAGMGAASSAISYSVTNYTNNYVETYNDHPEINVSNTNTNITHSTLNYDTYVENINKAKYDNSAFGYAGVVSISLLADDVTGVGVVDDIAIPFVWGGAVGFWAWHNRFELARTASNTAESIKDSFDPKGFKYVTYTKVNAEGLVYVGRSSGYGTPEQIVKERDRYHHMNLKNESTYGAAVVSNSIPATLSGGYPGRIKDPSYYAIRGSEQIQINYWRSQGMSGNERNGISEFNRFLKMYMDWGKYLLP